MKFSTQTNKVTIQDWLGYHPYSVATSIDNYYIALCNKVLKIIQNTDIALFTASMKEEKALACILVAYFEDVISETHLFSTFTHRHKSMYGKELPFYDISDDYYDDEVNLCDLYFLIWYTVSLHDDENVYDPFFENRPAFQVAVLAIYNLFESEFEKAPQNEQLLQFLQLPARSDVKTVRGKLNFIACYSYLFNPVYDPFFSDVIEKYKENDIVVLDEEKEMEVYDQKIYFIFNKYMPLLAMRVNEYYAAILGEEHSEYQFINNISERKYGTFLIRKIEKDRFLLEHLSSKKQIWLSNEYTSLENIQLIENKTILTIGLVHWKNNIWQNQGGCIINTIEEIKKDISDNFFDEKDRKKEILRQYEKAFLEVSGGKHIVYVRGQKEYTDFNFSVLKRHTEMINPELTGKKWDNYRKSIVGDFKANFPYEQDETLGLFFNPNGGTEIYRECVVSCMSDKANPRYANKKFDLCDLFTKENISKEFIDYVIENKLINFRVFDFENPDMLNILKDNLDFMLRFYKRSSYFSKPEVTIG